MPIRFQNPLPIQQIGDPFMLRTTDEQYICYATSAPDGFKAWVSTDLLHWQELGYVYRRRSDSWGVADFWAPEVVYHHGQYFMHYSARWRHNHSLRIGVAVADHPAGPFEDILNAPMFDFGYAAIDGHILKDDDGRIYLYYSRDCSENIVDGRHESHIYGIKLQDDLVSLIGQPVCLTRPEQAWEIRSGVEWRWNEGPFVLKNLGKYYLMYSANFYASRDYSVGYAVAEHPLGPFVKSPRNPILATNVPEISGPGHNSITTSPDRTEMVIVYHTHTDPDKPSGDRQVCLDRMGFHPDGSLWVDGPTL